MSTDSEVRKCKARKARSRVNLIYGVPFGIALIALVWVASRWIPIPRWLVFVLVVVELAVFAIDAINIWTLNVRIQKLQTGGNR